MKLPDKPINWKEVYDKELKFGQGEIIKEKFKYSVVIVFL